MGACASNAASPEDLQKSKEDKKKSSAIERDLANQHAQDQRVNKLLLLGAGESGKSTLFKHMIILHGKGFSTEERKTFVSVIHGNVMASAKVLAEWSGNLAGQGHPTTVSGDVAPIRDMLLDVNVDQPIDPQLAGQLARFWSDAGIQETYRLRNHFQLTDSTDYYFDKIQAIGRADFLPDEQDVLRSRVRTTGIVENKFLIDGNEFAVFDVGGQRNERKKWIHCFENVTAVLFVAALSEYDLKLFEDETVNRMTEAVTLFHEICASRWFRRTAMILFLNKKDLFEKKVKAVPLKEYFPDYDGPDEWEPASEFVKAMFVGPVQNDSRPIYAHVTNATDRNNMRMVFNAVKDIVIQKSLREGGLLT